jgi:hypothetical protein
MMPYFPGFHPLNDKSILKFHFGSNSNQHGNIVKWTIQLKKAKAS